MCVRAQSERQGAIKRWMCAAPAFPVFVCVARACVCVRSPPAAESRERRGTGRVGGEVMSGTRQRPTDEREGGGGRGCGSFLVLRGEPPQLLFPLR